jgi:hypothetical protein
MWQMTTTTTVPNVHPSGADTIEKGAVVLAA